MSQILYGAQLQQSPVVETDLRYDVLGADSEVFAVSDILTIDGGVVSIVDAATEIIYGVAGRSITMPATNDTVYMPVIPADNDKIWLMGTNSDLTDNETDYGTFYGITGATGAQQVNVSGSVTTTTSRQVMIVKVDPFKLGGSGSGSGLRQVLVKFVRTPMNNGAFN